ncbi:uncharacterized protein LOC111020104 [Momordica charantia]|uniref:Uncharacterized protein LOC111020104 n=1 Tax=Momordica charantia TaxID=3673 RepID=A0A6J1DHH3_MOMCH|nr:uncharacterized protein LOC111020104 [Momordica charantia]
MASGSILSARGGERFHDPHLYRSIVGSLQYATVTHQEISYSVNKAFPVHSVITHFYINGVLLSKSSQLRVHGFADADWASDPDDRKSTSGYCIYFGGNLVA